MNSNAIFGASVLTGLIGIPLCIFGLVTEGDAGLLSAVVFTFAFYQFTMLMALGGLKVGLLSLLIIAGEVFLIWCVCGLLFGQEVALRAASYWREPISWGAAPIYNLWTGIWEGDSAKKWLGVFQILAGAGVLGVVWGLINLLGRVGDET